MSSHNGARPWAHRTAVLGAFVGALGLDLWTKAWASSLVEPVRILDWLYLALYHNSGMFFGTVQVSVGYWIFVCAMLGWFGRTALRQSTAIGVCVAIILSGMVGNAIGQFYGQIVDFIAFGPVAGDLWLIANVADFSLVGGVVALGVLLIKRRLTARRNAVEWVD